MAKRNDLPDPSSFPRLLDASEEFAETYRKELDLQAECTRIKGEIEDAEADLERIQASGFDADEAAESILAGEDPELSDETTAGLEAKIERLERQLTATEAAKQKVAARLDRLRDGAAKVAMAADLKPDVEASSQRVADLVSELWQHLDWQYQVARHCKSQTNQDGSHSPTGRDISGILPYALPIRSGRWKQGVDLRALLNHLIGLADEGEIKFSDPRD